MATKTGPWLSPEETRAYLSLPSLDALYKMVRRGTIKGYRLGRLLRFSQSDLDAMISGCPTCK